MPLCWAHGELLYDPPEKLSAPLDAASDSFLGAKLTRRADAATSELLAFSPYFVPGEDGVKFFGRKTAEGVHIRVLTNSLAATDAWMVHAAYRKYRRPLLDHGVFIYELKPEARGRSGVKGSVGSSRSSLHGKTFVFDRSAVFVGSLNIDPRSLRQNTEVGILVEDGELARQVAALFDTWSDSEMSFQTVLVKDSADRIRWIATENGEKLEFETEPFASIGRRIGVNIMSHFPIENQV